MPDSVRPSDEPVASVVVVAFAGGDWTESCLDAILAQDASSRAEVVVAAPAGRSVDDRAGRVRIVTAAGPWGRVRAAGVAAATGAVVVLTEDHCRPDPAWLASLLRAHEDGHDVAGGPIHRRAATPWTWATYLQEYARFSSRPPADGGFSDCNVSYRRAVLETCRDAWWPAYHQTAVDAAVRERGRTTRWVPEAGVTDMAETALAPLLRQRYRLGAEFGASRPRRAPALAALRLLLAPLTMTARSATAGLRAPGGAGRTMVALPFILLVSWAWAWGEFSASAGGQAPA